MIDFNRLSGSQKLTALVTAINWASYYHSKVKKCFRNHVHWIFYSKHSIDCTGGNLMDRHYTAQIKHGLLSS